MADKTQKQTGQIMEPEQAEHTEETLEELFSRLDKVMEILENKETSLEDSFAAYEKGIGYLKECSSRIDRVEKKMLMINEEGGLDEF